MNKTTRKEMNGWQSVPACMNANTIKPYLGTKSNIFSRFVLNTGI
jgi:hypothetical protein